MAAEERQNEFEERQSELEEPAGPSGERLSRRASRDRLRPRVLGRRATMAVPAQGAAIRAARVVTWGGPSGADFAR